ncbi:hypothetical protein BN946_scf184912.g46 [Trametes cinnabarina]|uniref:2-oxoglutarate dehydrogenase, mitochondrial n=1 Tax=Pycnoporus cinnabarinus TaxID=5643 RepID=A0A060SSM7_PYCCI|nr:hypothetical protein BN946_scf184912.g46 [Trametes cinnabarina]
MHRLARLPRVVQALHGQRFRYGVQPLARSLATATKSPSPNDPFANGTNAYYVEEMYRLWRQDPKSVHASWDVYFSGMEKGLPSQQAFQPPPTLVSAPADGAPALHTHGGGELDDHLKVQLLVRAYQVRGHHVADLDPLGILDPDLNPEYPPELELSRYGFTERDLDKQITLGPGILPHFATEDRKTMSLGEIIKVCKRVYCGAIGIQYVHIPDKEQCDWIRERVEIPKPWNYTLEEKRMVLDRLIWSDSFEKFVASKYPNEKRFGLEGCESLIPGMKALIDRSVEHGVKHVTIGMPHRGRLNVLANVIRKPIEAILNEFSGTAEDDDFPAGDVKYHLGANYVRPTPSGKKVALSLVANPSHLEAEDPVVLGKTRALQHFEQDEQSHNTAMGVLLHGDAAFAGQGVVYETMGFHNLPNYGTGGTIHLIVNNQIGFTTDPRFARSTPYPSDIAKAIDAPIFHVNGDNVEAVNFVCQLAADWRAKWKKDVVIDIVCYRRYGHNETDQPSFTQPRMYKAIEKQPTTLQKYTKFLVDRGTFTEHDIEEHRKWVWGMLEKAAAGAKDYVPSSKEWLSASWPGFPSPKELAEKTLPTRPTGTTEETLKHIGKVISSFPESFHPHRNLARILTNRGKTIEDGKNIDWATAEALAFALLLTTSTYSALILYFSKSLLRHPKARSELSEMVGETHFQRYIPDPHPENLVAPEKIRRHILCTGQVYHTLLQEREDKGINDVVISRLEQISPFPYDLLTPHLDTYPNADLLWCQEEPLNNGAWTYVGPRVMTAANETKHHKGKYPTYAGREPTSSVATGSKVIHKKQIEQFLAAAFAQ